MKFRQLLLKILRKKTLRTDARTDGQIENSIPTHIHNLRGGGDKMDVLKFLTDMWFWTKNSIETGDYNPREVILRGKHTLDMYNQRTKTNGPVNAHLISWPSKAQTIQNLENIW